MFKFLISAYIPGVSSIFYCMHYIFPSIITVREISSKSFVTEFPPTYTKNKKTVCNKKEVLPYLRVQLSLMLKKHN